MTRDTHDHESTDDTPDGSDGATRASQGALSRRGILKSGAALGAGALAVGLGDTAAAATETNPSDLDLYLLFGQSNMEGQGPIEPQDRETNDRIHVIADLTCSNPDRDYGEWYLAEPPLNRCNGQLGPGDYFAKTMIDEVPEDRGIGLVPAAVSGADIALFEKGAPIGRNNRNIPSQFDGGYQWLLDLAEKAQEVGTIKGILFHQGETNTGQEEWTSQVQGIVEDLRSDLGIGDVPFLAGEMLYDSQGGCCASHNSEVNELPDVISNAHVVSADGLEGQDYAHFTTEAYRELGRRYANEMMEHVDTGGGGGGDGGGGGSATQQPYNGTPHAVPGQIPAEEYDQGGSGVAYSDNTSENEGGAMRTGEAVDISSVTGGTGYSVGYIESGEWVEYTVDVAQSGDYTLDALVASDAGGGSFHLEVGGTDVSGTVDVPATGGWDSWETVSTPGVSLDAGQQVIRVSMDESWWDLNSLDLSLDGGSGGGGGGDGGSGGGGDGSDGGGGGDGGDGSDGGVGGGSNPPSGDLVAEIDPDTTSASVGDRVAFRVTDTSADGNWIDSLSWSLGNGDTGSGWYVDTTYDSAGSYTVELDATNNEGTTTTDEVTVQIS